MACRLRTGKSTVTLIVRIELLVERLHLVEFCEYFLARFVLIVEVFVFVFERRVDDVNGFWFKQLSHNLENGLVRHCYFAVNESCGPEKRHNEYKINQIFCIEICPIICFKYSVIFNEYSFFFSCLTRSMCFFTWTVWLVSKNSSCISKSLFMF